MRAIFGGCSTRLLRQRRFLCSGQCDREFIDLRSTTADALVTHAAIGNELAFSLEQGFFLDFFSRVFVFWTSFGGSDELVTVTNRTKSGAGYCGGGEARPSFANLPSNDGLAGGFRGGFQSERRKEEVANCPCPLG